MLKAWRQSVQRRPPDPRGTLEDRGERPSVTLVDFSSLTPRKDEILRNFGDVPRGFALGTVGLHRTRALRLCRGHGHRLVCRNRSARPRTRSPRISTSGDCRSGTPPAQTPPPMATVFTTSHATVMGRCIAGNGLPLYMTCSSMPTNWPAVQRRGQALDRRWPPIN